MLQKFGLLLAGSAMSVTLAACYGAPCASDACKRYDDFPCPDATLDLDQDGYCGEFDCNEKDAKTFEGANDPLGDNIDQNCDGLDGVAGSTGATGITGTTGVTGPT